MIFVSGSVSRILPISSLQEEDEWLFERAAAADIFGNLQLLIVNCSFFEDEFKVTKMHQMLTDFILHFLLTMRDLQTKLQELLELI